MDVVISEIFLKLNGRAIFRNKTAADITAHIEWINNNLSKGSVPRHYLIANVYLQSKSAKIRLPAKTSKALKQEVASSVFKNSVSIQRYNAQSRERFDDKKEKNYYDVSGNSLSLKSILENYSGNPVLIDFGASWCLPCMQKIPEIEQYRKDFIDLNIVMISIEKSRDGWRKYLFDHKMENFSYYRVNSLNPDSLVKKIFEIPKYGFVNRNGSITILNEVNDSIIKNNIKTF